VSSQSVTRLASGSKRQLTIDQSIEDELAVFLNQVIDVAKNATRSESKRRSRKLWMY
jgi:hypothetical protein